MSDLSVIEALYFAALERREEERAAFLDQVCTNESLRRAVERLLTAERQVGDFLRTPPALDLTGLDAPAAGPCRLVEEIARGGMGVVLRARDEALGRDLAVKVLLPEHLGNAELRDRFLREARLTGRLQHPGIPPVHGVGQLPDGRPFFSMKLVAGQTLAQRLRARTSPSNDLLRLLGVFEQVCQAVAYAHSQGIIHRDLKPSNIMLGEFGAAQVMDWCLAQTLLPESGQGMTTEMLCGPPSDRGEATSLGAVLGTPGYLAPEQARGEHTDRRADVFGLGAVLCEILTGSPPYGEGTSSELIDRAAAGNLAEGYIRLASCGADAELLSLAIRCLASRPDDRPHDAAEVAEAVASQRRSLNERLRRAEAERAEAQVKATEERKRRRLTLALVASVSLMVVLGGGAWAFFMWQEARRAHEQTLRRQEADALLDQAARLIARGDEAALAEAPSLIERSRALAEAGGRADELLRRAEDMRAELDLDRREQQLLRSLASALLVGGRIDTKLGYYTREPGLPIYRRAFAEYGWRVGEEASDAVAERLRRRPTAVREAVATALFYWLNAGRAVNEPHLDWLENVLQTAAPESWAHRVYRVEAGPLARRRAALVALADEAAQAEFPPPTLQLLSDRLQRIGANAEAEQVLQAGLKQQPGDFWVHNGLGNLLRAKDPERALRHLSAALALRPDDPGTWASYGLAFHEYGKHEEARASLQHALELDDQFVMGYLILGMIQHNREKWPETMAAYRKALELAPKLALAHTNLGLALSKQAKHKEAVEHCRKAAELAPGDATVLVNLGLVLINQGDANESLRLYRRAITLDPTNVRAYALLGSALFQQGDDDAAIVALNAALTAAPNQKQSDTRSILGTILVNRGMPAEAVTHLKAAAAVDPKVDLIHSQLGTALFFCGRFSEARQSFQAARDLKPKDPSVAKAVEAFDSIARYYVTLEGTLSVVLKGDRQKLTSDVLAHYAEVCRLKGLHRDSAMLYAEAFAADPKAVVEAEGYSRIHAASAAARAGCDGKVPSAERQRWRRQALSWLSAQVAVWRRLATGPQRVEARQALQAMRADPNLAGLRDAGQLAQLPIEEQEACWRLWAEVEASLRLTEN